MATTTSTSSRPDARRKTGARRRPYRPRELRDAGIAPAKALGQHFLTDGRILSRVAAAARVGASDTVIEVGAGLGGLTRRLASLAGRVIAIEIDPSLCDYLRRKFSAQPNVAILAADALTVEPAQATDGAPYVLVGNLPFNAGLAILRHFLEAAAPPLRAVVMLQKEVAEAVAAREPSMTVGGIGVQVYAEVRKLFEVGPEAFYPPPRVRSAVLALDPRAEPLVPAAERERFFAVVRAGFSAPRKRVRNSLAQGLGLVSAACEAALTAAAVDPALRPSALSIQEWLRLARRLGA